MTHSWGYGNNNGPRTWATHFPDAGGSEQSPIDVCVCDAVFDVGLLTSPLTPTYCTEDGVELNNTGESFKVNIKKCSELRGGPLESLYRLEQFHLHWGSCDNRGSEHTINGRAFAAELHFVHWNCHKYNSLAEAADKPNGLAVIGVMIQCGKEHPGFKYLVEAMPRVRGCGHKCQVTTLFNPSVLLPDNIQEYWTYHGSLTTPPCFESVQWIVIRQPVEFSSSQLQSLRTLLGGDGDACIVDNFRPPLPLGDRKLRSSFNETVINYRF
ncbi:carbonic anhydrase 2-like [Dreissena polymorpha]|uniref:Carbonic anhydrase n=1 Tax=Dreissena polymorpha TaxID=45954 RepID=A0A9D4JLQ9_DREPO|nr:carbonic anhydrase 2-like [Dreissena polymorpha]KAH3812017.1 hypothetical protein DPMN_140438 [Dreissena polymorpha]